MKRAPRPPTRHLPQLPHRLAHGPAGLHQLLHRGSHLAVGLGDGEAQAAGVQAEVAPHTPGCFWHRKPTSNSAAPRRPHTWAPPVTRDSVRLLAALAAPASTPAAPPTASPAAPAAVSIAPVAACGRVLKELRLGLLQTLPSRRAPTTMAPAPPHLRALGDGALHRRGCGLPRSWLCRGWLCLRRHAVRLQQAAPAQRRGCGAPGSQLGAGGIQGCARGLQRTAAGKQAGLQGGASHQGLRRAGHQAAQAVITAGPE